MERPYKLSIRKYIPWIYLMLILSPVLLSGIYVGLTNINMLQDAQPSVALDEEGTKYLNHYRQRYDLSGDSSVRIQNDDGTYSEIKEYQDYIHNVAPSKIGLELRERMDRYSTNLKFQPDKGIPIILMFTEQSTKEQRVAILKNLGWESSIINGFSIIPAYTVEITLRQLMERRIMILNENMITGVFTDKPVRLDYISSQHSAITSAVTTENWWLEAVGALDLSYDGTGVNLAILDTGISDTHVDFINGKSQPLVHRNFGVDETGLDPTAKEDLVGHGTHCAGIAGGSGASNSDYVGIAPGVNLYNLRLSNSSGEMLSSWLISAIEWSAENNIDVISMSLSVDYNKAHNPVSAAIDAATSEGVVALGSIGNSGPHYMTGGYPGTGVGIISVGAVGENLDLTSFTSRGPNYQRHSLPHVLAPGYNVIAAEHRGSIISQTERYTNSYVQGSYANSDYIALSGTSMSCPMVAGAAAILLEAYPELTPEGIKSALMAGSYIPEDYLDVYSDADNGVGSGIINVSASLNWLAEQENSYELVQSFPDFIPYAPYDLLKYPGEEQHFNISILSTKNDTQSVDVTIPEIQGLEISISDSSLNFNNHSTQFIDVGVRIMENASVGTKKGLIFINKSGSDTIYDVINITLDVEYPRGNILYEGFHGLNDWYGWALGYQQLEIYDSMKYLHDLGYKMSYNMEYWTSGYNSSTDGSIITADKLSQSDIVVLQTPILPYADYEIEQLTTYVDNGGSVLLLGSMDHMINTESVNELLENLKTGITYKTESYFLYKDVGLGLQLYTQNVTWVNTSSSIFQTGDTYKFWYGGTLEVEGSAETHNIAEVGPYSVAAEYDGESLGKGNVVVFSDYHWLSNDVFAKNSMDLVHKDVLSQLVGFLNTRDSDLRLSAEFNTTQTDTGNVDLHLSVLNASKGQPVSGLVPGDSINLTLTDPDGTSSQLQIIDNGNGLYYNDSIYLSASDHRPYNLTVQIAGNSLIERVYRLYRIDAADQVSLSNAGVSDPKVDRSPGSYSTISFDGTISLDDVKSYASITSNAYINIRNSSNHILDMSWSLSGWRNQFDIEDNNSGYFTFFGIANESNFINFNSERNYFRIINYAPEIDEINSYLNQFSFNETHDEESIYGIPVTAGNQNVLTVKASDGAAYEDSLMDFRVATGYFAATSVSNFFQLIYPDTIPNSLLFYSSSDNSFQGSVVVPSTLMFTGIYGEEEVSQETPSSFKYFSILSVVVRDTEGGNADMLFLLVVDVPFSAGDLLEYWPIILVIVAIFTLIGILYWRSKRSSDDYATDYYGEDDVYSDYDDFEDDGYSNGGYGQSNNSDVKYCMHCGQKISPNSRICPYCGRRQ